MTRDRFIRVARVDELREGRGKKCVVEGEEIALWKIRGAVYAIGNICTHNHVSMLHEGVVEDLTVTCPMHGWTYSLVTGTSSSRSGRVPVYPVRVTEGEVFICLEPLP